ncbi:MAG: hypothetical protein Q9186_005612 [Xanthomendoza sp. 1 TL-2023]
MADNPDSDVQVPEKSADPTGQHPEMSMDDMKSLLLRAEQRLTGSKSQVRGTSADFNADRKSPISLPKLDPSISTEAYMEFVSGVARVDPARVINDNERRLADGSRQNPVTRKARMINPKVSKTTAGSDWFNLPRTNLTYELKRDLQLLKMRSTWDTKRHYKKDSRKPLVPEYSMVGTIIEGPTEHFSSRIAKRDRKNSFVDEIMAAEKATGRFKKKSKDIQTSKTSGRKAFYKSLKQKRSNGSIRP